MKRIAIIVVWVIAIMFALGIVKDLAIKVAVEKGVELVTGLKIEIKGLNVGVIRSVVSIKDLKVFNPDGFADRIMIDMPEIYVDYDLWAIITGNIHIREMRIELKELDVIKNQRGELNLNSLKVVKSEKQGRASKATEGGMPKMRIDVLQLKVGKAVYKDYSKGGEPVVQEFNINLNERFTNIDNPYALVGLLVVKTLSSTTISNLANFDLGGLSSSVSTSLSSAKEMASTATAAAAATVTQTKTAVKEASGALTKTAEGLSDIFKSPFGSEKK